VLIMAACVVVKDGNGDYHARELRAGEDPFKCAASLIEDYCLADTPSEIFSVGKVDGVRDPGAARLMKWGAKKGLVESLMRGTLRQIKARAK
jgi:hypothetical protein